MHGSGGGQRILKSTSTPAAPVMRVVPDVRTDRLNAQSKRLHQVQSMTDDNAYAPVVADSKVAPRNRRWMYRFLILNALLFGLPIGLAIAALIMLALNGVQISGTSVSLGWTPCYSRWLALRFRT